MATPKTHSRSREAPPVHRNPQFRSPVPRSWRQIRLVSKCRRIETAAGNVFAAGFNAPPSLWPVAHPVVADLLFKPTTMTLAAQVARLSKKHDLAVDEAAGAVFTHLPTLLSMGLIDVEQVDAD